MDVQAVLTRTVSCVAVAALAATVGGPASAAPPDGLPGEFLVFDHFEDTADETWIDGGDCELGFDVHYTRDVSGTVRFRARDGVAYGHVTAHGSQTWAANGHTFTERFSLVDRDREVVVEGTGKDGTLVITGQAAGGSRFLVDGRLAFRNPGMNRYQIRIAHNGTLLDPDDDHFVADLGLLKGSTGLNETEGRDFCEDLALFLGPDV